MGELNTALEPVHRQPHKIPSERKTPAGGGASMYRLLFFTTERPSERDTPPRPPPGSERDNTAERGQEQRSGRTADYPTLHRKEATEELPATLSCGVASIAYVLPGAPRKRAALCAERGSTPITPVERSGLK